MTTINQGPTLTDAKGMGGIIAQDGFDYQLWDCLIRLPSWLANPAFEELLFEGLEDFEARFFAPHSPHSRLLERYQAKSGNLTPAQAREVFESFHTFEKAHPHSARVHTLVTPLLPPTLSWLARDPARVRIARPFYAPFAGIVKACDDKLRLDLTNTYDASLANFIAETVEISEQVIPDKANAVTQFTTKLDFFFPHLDIGPRKAAPVFDALSELIRCSIGTPLSRKNLISLIETNLTQSLFQNTLFRMHVRSDRNAADEAAWEFDASSFSGKENPFPASLDWRKGLQEPLDRVSRWLSSRRISRITLGGSYRQTTAFAIGWSLRSASGFELEILTKMDMWATDDHMRSDEKYPTWEIAQTQSLDRGTLVVCVGVLRNPIQDVISNRSIPEASILNVFLPEAITSARSAQAGVSAVKAAISQAAAKLRPNQIDLYLVGPAAFAVALGHRWNAMPATQLFEFIANERLYTPTAIIG